MMNRQKKLKVVRRCPLSLHSYSYINSSPVLFTNFCYQKVLCNDVFSSWPVRPSP